MTEMFGGKLMSGVTTAQKDLLQPNHLKLRA
jgi:hypothetical protein